MYTFSLFMFKQIKQIYYRGAEWCSTEVSYQMSKATLTGLTQKQGQTVIDVGHSWFS